MRLRYLHLLNYPPLEDVEICFNPPGLSDRKCAIRFVVGVNGSGKTHLLQAIAETFVALARGHCPHFPITLAWQLGQGEQHRTLLFNNSGQGSDARWWQGDEIIDDAADIKQWNKLVSELLNGKNGWKELIHDGNWPGPGVGLPATVLAYTSGYLESWQSFFSREPSAAEVNIISQSEDYDTSIERPAGWNWRQEVEHQAALSTEESKSQLELLNKTIDEYDATETDQEICQLIDNKLLKFALLAVTLRQAMAEYRMYKTDEVIEYFKQKINSTPDEGSKLRRLLSQVSWVWPVCVIFQIDFNPDAWSEKETKLKVSILQNLYMLANEVVREPDPSTKRRLFFDLRSKSEFDPSSAINKAAMEQFFGGDSAYEFTGDALLQFLGGPESSPFDIFKRLVDLYRQCLITDVEIAVRKADVDDILLFDELSDGEQVYLGRMALFHLLEKEDDALLILDEPEVHFNDKWKREIVDIIDSVLKDRHNDVLIATHSSIALTDVFNDEIILFDKREGRTETVNIRSTTFGADPSEVMIRLFGVPDSMGERALAWLDSQLKREWTHNSIPELEKLLERIGPGFHRSELRGILRRLKERAV